MAEPYWRAYYFDVDPQDPDNTIVRHLQLNKLQIQYKTIHGTGTDPDLGNFVINGTEDNGNLSFRLKYLSKELYFTGTATEGNISGTYSDDPDYDVGSFHFKWVVPKPGWNGTYKQNNIDHDMTFHHFHIDLAHNGKVQAQGEDENGGFQFDGTYDPASNIVRFKKTYDAGYSWQYWGTLNGNVIEGSWGEEEPYGYEPFRLYRI